MKKIQKKQLKEGGKPKDESQEESENETKMTVKIKDENSSELKKTSRESSRFSTLFLAIILKAFGEKLSKLIKTFLKFRKFFFLFISFFSSDQGSNQYLQDSCSDTENGMCDTDSFGSRLSGNGSSSIAGEFKHIKEEIENDEDYFRLLANQTRTMRHFDGKYKFLHETHSRLFFQWSSDKNFPFFLLSIAIEGREKFMDFQWQLRGNVSPIATNATEWVICVHPNCRWYKIIFMGFMAAGVFFLLLPLRNLTFNFFLSLDLHVCVLVDVYSPTFSLF